ncbi:GntR family transcriptional regulator [Kitasatospora sp. NPDC051914]|uniref:GntR family transcriptional regulator n=1 Tax=Kitasatospora sp. NPDC051914 TaxID=3154945 RepID=UPI003440827D
MNRRNDEERAPYQKAADALRQDIAEGRLKAGDKLPALSEIEKRFSIANMTARSAVRVLREENLVYAVQGVGTFVRATPQPEPAAETAEAGGETVEVSAADLAKISELVTGLTAQVQQLKEQQEQIRARLEEVERSSR